MNAVIDALASRGINHFDLPASPDRVWAALAQAVPTSAATRLNRS
jgi:carbon-monoxide dehydrogenase large subunit